MTEPANPNPSSEIRKHYFMERYVIIAPKRNLRPDSFAKAALPHKTETDKSPALEKDPAIFQIGNDSNWQVKVVANAFPALSLTNPAAFGLQEVIIETPKHNYELSQLPVDHILQVFEAYRHRLKALSKIEGVRYVQVFKNDGPSAGASIAHAHSQVIALPLIPPKLQAEAMAAERYQDKYNRCPYCEVIDWEQAQKERIIEVDEHLVALAPYASSSPFGAWILPKRHVASFTQLHPEELRSFAKVLKKIITKLDSVPLSFNYFLQEPIPPHPHHFVLKIEPRPNLWAGLELGTGIIINSVNPEYAAKWYRD